MKGGRTPVLLLLLFGAAIAGCVAPVTYDYGPWLDHMPRTVVVLPPLNETPEVTASYGYLSTVTRPIVQWGYYVVPVAVVDAYLKENGHPTPFEMHQVPVDRLGEVFGADAVLYLTVRSWGKEYQVINCHVGVSVDAVLVDCRTGTLLWTATGSGSEDSFGQSQDPTFGILSALVAQVLVPSESTSRQVASRASSMMLPPPHPGPRHPKFAEEARKSRERVAEAVKEGRGVLRVDGPGAGNGEEAGEEAGSPGE